MKHIKILLHLTSVLKLSLYLALGLPSCLFPNVFLIYGNTSCSTHPLSLYDNKSVDLRTKCDDRLLPVPCLLTSHNNIQISIKFQSLQFQLGPWMRQELL